MKNLTKVMLLGAVLSTALFASIYPSHNNLSEKVSVQQVEVVRVLPHYTHLKDASGEISILKFTQRCHAKQNIEGQMIPVNVVIKELQNGNTNRYIERDSVVDAICMS